MPKNLFSSYTLPVPPLRFDIQRIPVHQNGQSFIYFHDILNYATSNFALPVDAEPILSLIDGSRSVEDILKFGDEEVTKEQILGYIRFLDEHALLDSEHFAKQAELIESKYEKSLEHTSITAGSSYPDNPDELLGFLKNAFSEYPNSKPVKHAKALFAPHIDPRIGMESYVKSFSAIRDLKPSRVVILATSHYSGLYGDLYEDSPFIISNKTFKMPNGEVKSDIAAIQKLKGMLEHTINCEQKKILKQACLSAGRGRQVQEDPVKENPDKKNSRHAEPDSASVKISQTTSPVSFSDRAHRIEHSIELHLLFLNHIWNHDFKIIPMLIGNLDELLYTSGSYREQQVTSFANIVANEFGGDSETFFLISGDLCHIGKKFGDPEPASTVFDKISAFDHTFLNAGSSGKAQEVLHTIRNGYDPYRVCGFPPLFTFLKAFPNIKGTQISYDLWDEREQESAVSFGSILFN